MKRAVLVLFFAAACATHLAHAARDLFGVRVRDPKSLVHTRLGSIGTLVREERNRQEVWDVRDPRYRGAIVGYDAEGRVRFITAVAKEDGERVPYSAVLDLSAATHRVTGTTHNYRWAPAGSDTIVIAIGNDPVHLQYVTLTTASEAEPEED